MSIFKVIEYKGKNIIKKVFSFLLPSGRSRGKNQFNNVIIVRIDERLGNLVLLNSVVKSFIKNKIKTSLFICSKYGLLYRDNRELKEVIYFNKKSLFNPINIFRLAVRLRRKKYDLMFDASNPNDLSTLSFFMMFLIKADVKFGYQRKESDLVLNKLVPRPEKTIHMLDYYSMLFKHLKLPFIRDIRFHFKKSIREKYKYLKEKKKKIIIVHPGGRSSKQWRVERLVAFLEKIRSVKYKFVVLLGPDEYDKEGLFLEKKYIIIKPRDVLDLASILYCGDIYIGNDSGPTHLAGSLGLSIFAFFKPEMSIVYKPVAKKHKLVISESPRDLSIEEVLKKYKQFIHGV